MSFNPAVFGEGFHIFVQSEYQLLGSLAPVLHITTYAILILVVVYGNRVRRIFSVYFTINWVFLFAYWGIYGSIYWLRVGIVYLAVYAAAPILLTLITYNWIREIVNPRIDLDVRESKRGRVAVLIILLWGLWYPAYIYGQGFLFEPRDMLFSFFGLMPCPTTMVVLSIMTMKYPNTNKDLFHLFTMYALFIGSATVLSGWLPDIPFILLGMYALFLAVTNKRRNRGVVGVA